MIIQGPEIFNSVESDDGALIVLPIAIFVILKKPQRPRILKMKSKVVEQCPKMTNFDALGQFGLKMGQFGLKMGQFGLNVRQKVTFLDTALWLS